jgi:hypothetical protein
MDESIDLNIFDIETIRAAGEADRAGSRRARRHLDALSTVSEFVISIVDLLESSEDYKAISSASSPTIVAEIGMACWTRRCWRTAVPSTMVDTTVITTRPDY